MDLEQRARDLFAAMDNVQVDRILAFFSTDCRYHVRGVTDEMDRAAFERYLRTLHKRVARLHFQVDEVVVKRNLTFVEWRNGGALFDSAPFVNHGVHVLSWNQDGLVTHATVYTVPETVRTMLGPAA